MLHNALDEAIGQKSGLIAVVGYATNVHTLSGEFKAETQAIPEFHLAEYPAGLVLLAAYFRLLLVVDGNDYSAEWHILHACIICGP